MSNTVKTASKGVKIALISVLGLLVLLVVVVIISMPNAEERAQIEKDQKHKDSLAILEQVKNDSISKAAEAEKERAFNALPKAERERIIREREAQKKQTELKDAQEKTVSKLAEMKKKLDDRTSVKVMQNQADDYIEEHLKDPDSYDNIDYTIPQIEENNGFYFFTFAVKYRAKNSFGATIIETSKVVLREDGYTVMGAKKLE